MSAPLTADQLRARKGGVPLAMLTAYDYPTAHALDLAGLDILLVGDSLGEVELGYDSTRAVSLEMMAHHVRAVRNGVSHTHICGDLVAGSYATAEQAVASARALVAAGADSVKLEGALVDQVRAIVAAGIPVMGHVGLLPQTATDYRRQGTDPQAAERILADARALDEAGCYAIVIEAVAPDLARRITAAVGAPTIGIAAGDDTDGQVLVVHDLIGLSPRPPAFVAPRANVHSVIVHTALVFAKEVHGEREPSK
ncbi:MAG TPA: 3-methyl-2-oxobutanoate hydroxymethyltransferase [Miltoncostaeaceae bacterium]|nr:3-methyl-2-oxobutanoate hydroxymethyltransferase [Miltoncostaeaceae bacterium]